MTTAGDAKFAITGASGFVGRQLVQHLQSRGLSTISLDRRNTPDFSDQAVLQTHFAGCRAVIHLLGRAHILNVKNDPTEELAAFRRVNRDMALASARAAADAGVPLFIHVSSVAVLGAKATAYPLCDTSPTSPSTPYGISKLEAEDALEEFGNHSGLRVLSLRPPLIYGPGAPGNFARLVSAIRRGWPLPFGLVTENRRTFVSVENLSEAIETALARPKQTSGRFIVADSESLSTRATIEAIAAGMGKRARLLPVPPGLIGGLLSTARRTAMAQQLIGSLEFDGSRLYDALDWRPRISPRDGLGRMGKANA